MALARKFSAAFARHVVEKFATATIGSLFVSDVGQRIRRTLSARVTGNPAPGVRAAVIAHVYYVELLDEILACREAIPGSVPLYLTVPTDRLETVAGRVAGLANVHLHPYENRGRDIAPFMGVLSSGALDGYDAVLKLHTKRSPHLIDGETRRKLLFAMLCGGPSVAARVLAAFEHPATGMVGWRFCYRTGRSYWMKNEARVREIASRMGADRVARLGFFEGSMFWFRPAALAALRELHLNCEDFEPEARQLDGTLHHAIERCFTIAAWARGYVVRDLRGRVLP